MALFPVLGQGQDKPAYQWFDGKGKKTNFKNLLKKATQQDVVLFGELHNNPIAHWMQYELLREAYKERPQMALAGEMFETDQQNQMLQYLKGHIDEETLLDSAKLWPNYKTDYAPMVRFAKEWGIPLMATNIPRPYAKQVYYKGIESLDTLPEHTKALIAPLPIVVDTTLASYRKMGDMMGGHGGGQATYNFICAQAIKDATMAHFILKALATTQTETQTSSTPGWVLHLNGAYHSDDREGIVWYLLQTQADLKILTITTVEQKNLKQLETEHFGKADFILVVPETMTKTY